MNQVLRRRPGRPYGGGAYPRFLLALLLLVPGGLGALTEFFWEAPDFFSAETGSFPVAAFSETLAVVAWQERGGPPASGEGEGTISISLGIKAAGEPWRIRRAVAGPYPYSGAEPAILSIAVDQRDRIIIAAAASSTETEILVSPDRGESFRSSRLGGGSESSVAPRIFVRSDGGCLLFVTRGEGASLNLYYARSDDALAWSPFEPFIQSGTLTLNFLPTHAAWGAVEYVVFQSFVGGADTAPSFQLYLKTSADGGRTWTDPQRFTDFRDPWMNTSSPPERFDNQRPHLSVQREGLLLVWERRFAALSPQIYAAFLGEDGRRRGNVERVNSASAYCNNPLGFSFRGEPTVVWFDNRRGGNRVFLAQREDGGWENTDLSGASGDSSFARPVVSSEGLSVFWQGRSRGERRIVSLAPDTSVAPPHLTGDNFSPGRRNRGDRVRLSWKAPEDSSGIRGFSWYWGQDETGLPPRELMSLREERLAAELIAGEDGSWFFSLAAQDRAGNWSDPARIEYVRDTTPPPAANIIPPVLDERGFLPSNTFELHWNPPPASDIAGYTWALDYLGPASLFRGMDAEEFRVTAGERFSSPPVPVPRIMGEAAQAAFDNQDDGVYRFSVSTIDEVGNIGPPSRLFFRTDKYVPRTYLSYVDARQDEQGILRIRIIGRGFAVGGAVGRVFLRREGEEPAAAGSSGILEFFAGQGDFTVLSDREIGGLRIEGIPQGSYRIGVEHPLRGIALYPQALWVDETGTVKFGDYSRFWEPSWTVRAGRRHILDSAVLMAAAILGFGALGLLVSVRGMGSVIAEGALIRENAKALITGDFMPSEKKQRARRIRRRGMGLRLKLASFTIILVLLVVTMVSAPLYLMMTATQRETLLRGLWDRSSVFLEGLATGTRVYLPSQNTLALGDLLGQMDAVPEAGYVTITGYGGGATIFSDHIWATNDPDILMKIDTADFTPGVSRLRDQLSPRLESIAQELNGRARLEVGELSQSIAELTREGLSLTGASDPASRQRLQDIQASIRSLELRLSGQLADIGWEIGSEPAFFSGAAPLADQHYLLFKPVLFRQGTEDTYFRGLIRVEISLESILTVIAEGQKNLLRVILVVALAAIGIGAAGALVLSTLIIRPVSRLVSHVERIRDTEDKAQLEGVDIEIRSQDELAVLGATINDMTHGLVRAAQAAADLSIGKEFQKKFIPLELDREGNKLSAGHKDTPYARFFGYYEGAKGVSGDYFDYLDLDGRYYAIIKCDVAGKGIPAALIMIQVATMFLNYFKAWKPSEQGMRIQDVVYQINEFIETLGFQGRFAAFTLCIFDSQTGLLRFCNAGDNLIHLFDASEGQVKTITLAETPATGVLPNFLVEAKGGYRVETLNLDSGDILLLYTDGIEEAKRKFRDQDFKEIFCTEGPQDTPHANHSSGQGAEELGADRVVEIINAVQNRALYTLHKYHNPEGELDLKFDFSSCEPSLDETIMALVSVEKIFRCYRNPRAGEGARVLVDRKVDVFLKKHFLQYRTYCTDAQEKAGDEAYLYYTRLEEDAQYDDLTILGIMRK